MRLPRPRRWLPIALTLFVMFLLYALWPAKTKFTVRPETTYITEPLDANGFVDYPKALNDRLSHGITPENNAKVLIMQALGPKPEGAEMPPEFFRRLGIERPPDDGSYLITFEKLYKIPLTPTSTNPFDVPKDVTGLFDPPDNSRKRWDAEQEQTRNWPWKATDHPEIAEWLKQNEKPLALIAEACKRTKYYNPLVSKIREPQSLQLGGVLLPSVQKCRAVANLLATRSMLHVGNGNFEQAWRDLIVCQKLGRLVANGGTMIEELVGIAIVAIASHKQVVLLSHAKVSSKQILDWQAELRKLPAIPSVADKLALGERFIMLDVLMTRIYRGAKAMDEIEGIHGELPPGEPTMHKMLRRSVDYDPTFKLVNGMCDRAAAACRLPNRAGRKNEIQVIEREVMAMQREAKGLSPLEKLTLGQSGTGEYFGKGLISILLSSFMKIQDAIDRAEQTERNLQVAFALAAYRSDTGQYPATLNELAPKYLAKIPGDMFSGKPLVYRLTDDGYLLYSVGLNEVDDEGQSRDDQPGADDIRVWMPVPVPAKKDAD